LVGTAGGFDDFGVLAHERGDAFAHPLVRAIRLARFVPVREQRKRLEPQRQRLHGDRQQRRHPQCIRARQRQQQVARRGDLAGGEVVLADELDVTEAPVVAEQHVERLRFAVRRHREMPRGEIVAAPQRAARQRMIVTHRDDERVVEQVFGRDARARLDPAIDDQIEIARRELALDVMHRDAAAHEAQARCFVRESGDDLWQRDRFEHVADADRDAQVERRRIEGRRVARGALQAGEMKLHVRDDRARAFGRRDAVALAHEQRIVEMRAQPVERMRDGRLRQVQRAGGRADAAVHVDGVEHAEQVQVETMVGGHGCETEVGKWLILEWPASVRRGSGAALPLSGADIARFGLRQRLHRANFPFRRTFVDAGQMGGASERCLIIYKNTNPGGAVCI